MPDSIGRKRRKKYAGCSRMKKEADWQSAQKKNHYGGGRGNGIKKVRPFRVAQD